MDNNSSTNGAVALVARIFMATIFIFAGWGKIPGMEGTVGYMSAMGVPAAGLLIYPTILVELGGGILLLLGYQTRVVAYVLALFSIVAALIFHMGWADPQMGQTQMIMFMKNFAMAGGLFMTAIAGAGKFSVDARTAGAKEATA